MTKIASVSTVRRRIAAQLVVYSAEVDVAGDVNASMFLARRHNVAAEIVNARGPAGWPIVQLRSRDRRAMRRVLEAFGYGDEVKIDVR